jgi:hypothetical protein
MPTVTITLTPTETRDILAGLIGIEPDLNNYPDSILGPAALTYIDARVRQYTADLVAQLTRGIDFCERDTIRLLAEVEARTQLLPAAYR